MAGEVNGAPQLIENGRYAIRVAPDGENWQLNRAVGLCATCATCGCGDQAEPVPLPDFTKGRHHLMSWAMAHVSELRAVLRA